MGVCEGGGFSERSSATSIGAANGRLFRLRKTAMLSRHWRLWLSFPSSRSLPKSSWRLGRLILLAWFRLKVGRGFLRVGCGHGG